MEVRQNPVLLSELDVVPGLESAELVQAFWLVSAANHLLVVDAILRHADVLPLDVLLAFEAFLLTVLEHELDVLVVAEHVLLVVVGDQGRLARVVLDLQGVGLVDLGLGALQVDVVALLFVEDALVDR